ncbi:hypothetical protein [Lapidilactobacillus bayanensis]|uniref:hypothetical protein n=1 Tax=Lapidilactobacillus bayanensis TaxID=2485998 RepID=UPI000F7ACAF1|nr:hypothetical protein [Lapidilactobacillus bayanensis]
MTKQTKSKLSREHPIYARLIGICLIGPFVLDGLLDWWMGLIGYQSNWQIDSTFSELGLDYISPFIVLMTLGIDLLIIAGVSLAPQETWRRIKQHWLPMLIVFLMIIALNLLAFFALKDVLNFFRYC